MSDTPQKSSSNKDIILYLLVVLFISVMPFVYFAFV
jgi:hypothetical protein